MTRSIKNRKGKHGKSNRRTGHKKRVMHKRYQPNIYYTINPRLMNGGCGCSSNSLNGQMFGGRNVQMGGRNVQMGGRNVQMGGRNVQMGGQNIPGQIPLNQNTIVNQGGIPARNIPNPSVGGGHRRKTQKNVQKGGGLLSSVFDPILGYSNNPILNANTSMGSGYAANVVTGNLLPPSFGITGLNQPAMSFYNNYNKAVI